MNFESGKAEVDAIMRVDIDITEIKGLKIV